MLLHLIYHKDKKTCCVFKKVQYRPMSLHIAASDIIITRADLVLFIPKSAISPMSLHIAAFDISQGQNWCCVFKKVQYRPKSLHMAVSIYHTDRHSVGIVHSKRCNIALCLCILLHPIYHKNKTGVVYSKRCNIA